MGKVTWKVKSQVFKTVFKLFRATGMLNRLTTETSAIFTKEISVERNIEQVDRAVSIHCF